MSAIKLKIYCSRGTRKTSQVPILYHSKDHRKQNIEVAILRTKYSEKLDLNDEEAIHTSDWHLGYALTFYSSQGLTIHNPSMTTFIIDDYLQWSNVA